MFVPVPQPLGDTNAGCSSFPLDNFPPQLREILESIAGALGVPVELVVGPFFGVANTAQGRAVIRVNDSWSEPGPIFNLTAASTGARKSPVLRAARDPLIAIQTELERETRGDVEMAQARIEAQTEKIKSLKSQLAVLTKSGGRSGRDVGSLISNGSGASSPTSSEAADNDVNLAQVEAALRIETDTLAEMQDAAPTLPKLWFDDPTSEKLHDIVAENPHPGIMVAEARDILLKLVKGDVQLKGFLSAYSMETNSRDLVSRSVRTAHEPSMAAVLVTQTAFLREVLADTNLRDSGFLDRFLVLWVARFLPPPIQVLRADQLCSRGLRNTSEADQMWDRYIRYEVRRTFPLGRQTLTFGIGDDLAARRLNLYLDEVRARQNDAGSSAELGYGTILHKLAGQALRYARLCAQFQIDPPDFASPLETPPVLLDPTRIYPVSARDIDAGFDVAWRGLSNVERLLGRAFDTAEALEQLAVAVLTVAMELIETDPQFDYTINARRVQRKRFKLTAEGIEAAFKHLIETGWAVDVTAQIPRARSTHIQVRPDLVLWLLEYGYVETRDASDPTTGNAA